MLAKQLISVLYVIHRMLFNSTRVLYALYVVYGMLFISTRVLSALYVVHGMLFSSTRVLSVCIDCGPRDVVHQYPSTLCLHCMWSTGCCSAVPEYSLCYLEHSQAREFTTSHCCLLPQLLMAVKVESISECFPGPWDHRFPGPWHCSLSKEAWLAGSILSKAKIMPLPSSGPLWLGNVDSSASPGPKQDCLAGLCGLSIN